VIALAVAAVGTGVSAWLARAARRFAVLDRLRTPERPWLPQSLRAPLLRALDAAAIDRTPEAMVQLWLLATFLAGVVGCAFDVHVGLLVALAVLGGVPAWLFVGQKRRARAVAAAVPDALERIAAELRAGGTLATAVAWLAGEGGPLAGDLTRVQSRVELGARFPEALAHWAAERRGAGIDSAAGALALAHEVGGASADALESLAASLRDRLAIAAETQSLSAQARYSALVVGLAPLGYFAFSTIVDRRVAGALLTTGPGLLCALGGIALELVGAWWMRRILASGAVT
jgi:tight adherence protein B